MNSDNSPGRAASSRSAGAAGLLRALRAQASRPEQAGAQLPSVRELVARHRVGPVTVERVLGQLNREGLVVTRPGRGSFVAERRAAPAEADWGWQSLALGSQPSGGAELLELLTAPPGEALPLGSGYPDEALQPVAALAAAAVRASRRPQVWGKAPPEGLESLRAWFAREAGAPWHPRDVLIVPGGQAGLATAFGGLLRPGAPLLVESPTWLGALAAARAAGLRVVPVPVDAGGVQPEALARAFAATGAQAFYSQPTFHNPTGASLAPERRRAVLAAAASAGAFVIEDDFARDLALDGAAPPPLARDDDSGRVVYLRSLTKAAAPSLRVAALCAKGPAALRLRAARVAADLFVSGPLQEMAVELVSSPAWARHLKAFRAELRGRRDALLAALRRHVPWAQVAAPKGGFCLWARLPEGADEARLAGQAAGLGVWLNPGRPWFPAEPTGPHWRLSYAAAPAPVLVEAVRRLGRLDPERVTARRQGQR